MSGSPHKTSTPVHRQAQQQPATKKPLGPRSPPPAGSAASIEAASKAKELEAWKRRKNYDPLKAVGGGAKKPQQQQQPQQSPVRQIQMVDDSYSEDTLSDVDAKSNTSAISRSAAAVARPNRAFALRQSNAASEQHSPKRTPPGPANQQDSFARSDGGRWSLRNKNQAMVANGVGAQRGAMSSSVHRMSSVGPTVRKPNPAVASIKGTVSGGRSTSSLSSKEAEFQAWKRRKNYDPLRSSANKPAKAGVSQGPAQAKASSNIKRGDILPSRGGSTVKPVPHPTMLGAADANLLRSASFHYPDGVSKVHLNVYTSEDDDEEDHQGPREFPSGLYEVNEDELILAIGGGGGGQGIRPPPRPRHSVSDHWPGGHAHHHHHSGAGQRGVARGSAGSTGSSAGTGPGGQGTKLEALDNLVISTIFSISAKLCLTSGKVIRRLQEQTEDKEHVEYLDTLVSITIFSLK